MIELKTIAAYMLGLEKEKIGMPKMSSSSIFVTFCGIQWR